MHRETYAIATSVKTKATEQDVRPQLIEYHKILDVDSFAYFISPIGSDDPPIESFVVMNYDMERIEVCINIIKSIIMDLDKESVFTISHRYN